MADSDFICFAAGGCCCCSLLIFFIVFLATSLKTVEQTEWCLKYSWWTESVAEDPITTPGMTFIGMGNYLVRYPNTNKYVYYRDSGISAQDGDISVPPIAIRTKDGLDVSLQIDLVYRLQQQNLYNLYMLVGEGTDEVPGWHTPLTYVAEGIIDNLATQFNAREIYTNRSHVSNTFENELRRVLSEQLYIDLQQLQLHTSKFPPLYDAMIQETQQKQAEIAGALQQRQTSINAKQGDLFAEKALVDKTLAQARGTAQQVEVDNEARVSQFIYETEQEAQGYTSVLNFFKTQGSWDANTQFNNYLNVKALATHDVNTKTVKVR